MVVGLSDPRHRACNAARVGWMVQPGGVARVHERRLADLSRSELRGPLVMDFLCPLRQRRQAPVGGVDDQRGACDQLSLLVRCPVRVVRGAEIPWRGGHLVRRSAFGGLGFELGQLSLGVRFLVPKPLGPFQRRLCGERIDALQVGITPGRAAWRPCVSVLSRDRRLRQEPHQERRGRLKYSSIHLRPPARRSPHSLEGSSRCSYMNISANSIHLNSSS